MNKTDKKIEEIKREIMGIVMAAKPSSQPNLIHEQLERLDTEVQKAVREHIVGFLKWFETYEYQEWDGELIETYLQSLDKGDTDDR